MAKQLIDRALRLGEGRKFKSYQKRVDSINRIEPEMEILDDAELLEEADSLRERARNGESLDELLPESFALTREAARRSLGQRHYDVQLIGGMVVHDGAIAEMKTGEGKTLTSTLAIVLNTLAGGSVHVVTVNDYLSKRDALWMKPIFDMLGVTVGWIQEDDDPEERRAKYACDITYGTNSEFGFDYLRDNMAPSLDQKVQRTHDFAIVDEVDNILIDEARTPLIISGAPEQAAQTYYTFARLAKQLDGVPAKTKLKSMGESKDTSEADYDYEFDEKHKTVAPTERGVNNAEKFLGLDNLYLAENGNMVNHLIQSLKAESLYRKDKDYAVVDGEVMIIDEFTGRILEGRRWSEGLHQAVEAKEGVAIREENQTLATITLQNYFRLYEKLSGMTGTALTEATEFMKIYKVPVVEVPTNKPTARDDQNDQIFKTREGKWKALIRELTERHETGQPILVGTVSVETSEMISNELKKRGIVHEVLNAKPEYAEREGETIAQAGRKGALTIATNMAGRGVDIKLGGDPEGMAHPLVLKQGLKPEDEGYNEAVEKAAEEFKPQTEAEAAEVRELGGLFICGTERHESRRIDNQLRGRAGRQGDPGASRFFLSAEDDVIRLFAGDRIYKILDRLGPVGDDGEEMPLEAKMLTKTVENAQKKVEEQNFLIRKRVLEYDDVMNEQRRVVYKYRGEILEGRDMSEIARDELSNVIERLVDEYTPGDLIEDWSLPELDTQLHLIWPCSIDVEGMAPEAVDREGLKAEVVEDAQKAYSEREAELGEEVMRYLERTLLMQVIDSRWREHLYDMDYLREGIHLRGFAQIDPLVAYKNEGYSMFSELMNAIWEEFSKLVFNVEIEIEPEQAGAFAAPTDEPRNLDYAGGTTDAQPSALTESAMQDESPSGTRNPVGFQAGSSTILTGGAAATKVKSDKENIGRNDPCWCGSGKKFKKCHGS
ncbi:MAG TPA: preprotein translocase subunit SecA [Solirubrobacterales bacterium]|nr:preprotein translocase subunit SecA [Solirubrobacterales bacterium]